MSPITDADIRVNQTVFLSGPFDPRITPMDAPLNAVYRRTGPLGGVAFRKLDSGPTVNWIVINETGGGGGGGDPVYEMPVGDLIAANVGLFVMREAGALKVYAGSPSAPGRKMRYNVEINGMPTVDSPATPPTEANVILDFAPIPPPSLPTAGDTLVINFDNATGGPRANVTFTFVNGPPGVNEIELGTPIPLEQVILNAVNLSFAGNDFAADYPPPGFQGVSFQGRLPGYQYENGNGIRVFGWRGPMPAPWISDPHGWLLLTGGTSGSPGTVGSKLLMNSDMGTWTFTYGQDWSPGPGLDDVAQNLAIAIQSAMPFVASHTGGTQVFLFPSVDMSGPNPVVMIETESDWGNDGTFQMNLSDYPLGAVVLVDNGLDPVIGGSVYPFMGKLVEIVGAVARLSNVPVLMGTVANDAPITLGQQVYAMDGLTISGVNQMTGWAAGRALMAGNPGDSIPFIQ